jgi:hypothetical protein
MKLFNIDMVTWNSASDFHSNFKKRMILHTILESVKTFSIVGIAALFVLEYIVPLTQKSLRTCFPAETEEFISNTKSADFPAGMEDFICPTKSADSGVKEVLHLANLIRLITENQLPETKMLRYAGLIFHASRKYGVNPLEIIAIIVAESNFRETSINKDTGDYGLGQINWEHWGKELGLMPHELLDPSINIILTCRVYKFFGKDFGKYHRGNGIQCDAYVVNVKSILSTLNAFIETNKDNIS